MSSSCLISSASGFNSSAVLRQPGGVEVRHGSSLDLKRLSLDVVAGDLLAGLADGDGLAALAADVNGLAALLPAHLPLRALQLLQHVQLLVDGSLCDVEGLRRSVVSLQVLDRLFAQGDDMHLLGLVRHLTLQHADGVNLRGLLHHVTLSDQGLHVARRLGEECESRVCRLGRLPTCGDEADLLVMSRHKINVLHIPSHHQLDLLLGTGRQLVLLELEDVADLLLWWCWCWRCV